MTIFQELKRRNVFRVTVAYVVAAWLLMSVADLVLEVIGADEWVLQSVVALLVIGFIPAVIFAWAFEITTEGIKRESQVDRAQSITHHTAKKLDLVTIGLLITVFGIIAVDRFFPGLTQREPGIHTTAVETEAEGARSALGADSDKQESNQAPPAKSIAVLPFVNMSPDPEQEYFADGISEEILNALARVEDLKVAGRTSSFAFKGQNQDLKIIGKALRVSHILEGSVRKAGNKLRITAQLVKVEDGYHMWSETYDRELTDVFAIQDEISAAILIELKAQLEVGQSIASIQADPQAYAQYLLAKQRIYERNQASLELAVELLQKAVDRDPGFAAAYAQLGIATLLLSEEKYGKLPNEQAQERGLQHLEKSLALDSRQAEALAGMGLYHGGIPGGAQAEVEWLEKSLASDPNQVNASNWLARNFAENGRLRDSLVLREKDFARDPLYMPVFSNLVQSYAVFGQYERAIQVLGELQPYLHDDANMMMTWAMVYNIGGQYARADQALQEAHEKEPTNFVNNLWYCFNLINIARYETCAELDAGAIPSIALSRLGRTEEALIFGHEAASKGQFPGPYFQALVENGRYRDLVEFVEARWTDLAAFKNDFPGARGYGGMSMGFIAESYGRIGNEEKFKEAVDRARAGHDRSLAEGADNSILTFARAHLAVLVGDYDSALSLLERAFAQGLVIDLVNPTAWPAFQPLRGKPRFEAAKTQMLEHLNAERSELGLEPLRT